MQRKKWLCCICGAVYGSTDGYKRHHKEVHAVCCVLLLVSGVNYQQEMSQSFERVVAMDIAERAAAIRSNLSAPPPVCNCAVIFLCGVFSYIA